MARLVVESAEVGSLVIELNLGANRLGSSPVNDFQIEHPTVSPRHCELVLSNDGVVLRDCASANGTFVDGRQVRQTKLSVGQTVRLGEVELVVESTEVTIAIPKFGTPQDGRFVVTPGSLPACARHPDAPATHRCTRCGETHCAACARRTRKRGGRIDTPCPHCSQVCEVICSRHCGARATHQCTQCRKLFCDACVRKLRRSGGKVLKLCHACTQECVLICPRHPEARATYRCTHCRVAVCDACARRTRRRSGGLVRVCPLCRHSCELICVRHPETRATHRCTHCQELLCGTCVQRLRGSKGAVLKFCALCGQPCEPLEGAKPKKESLLKRLQGTVKLSFARDAKAKPAKQSLVKNLRSRLEASRPRPQL